MVKEFQKVSQDKAWIDFQFHPFLANNFTLLTLAISTTQHTDINVHLRGKCKLNWLTWKIGLTQRGNKRYEEWKKEIVKSNIEKYLSISLRKKKKRNEQKPRAHCKVPKSKTKPQHISPLFYNRKSNQIRWTLYLKKRKRSECFRCSNWRGREKTCSLKCPEACSKIAVDANSCIS